MSDPFTPPFTRKLSETEKQQLVKDKGASTFRKYMQWELAQPAEEAVPVQEPVVVPTVPDEKKPHHEPIAETTEAPPGTEDARPKAAEEVKPEPKEEGPFLEVNGRTVYKTHAEAIRGFQEAQDTITRQQRELESKKQDPEVEKLRQTVERLQERLDEKDKAPKKEEAPAPPASRFSDNDAFMDEWDKPGGQLATIMSVVEDRLNAFKAEVKDLMAVVQGLHDVGADVVVPDLVRESHIMRITMRYPEYEGWDVPGSDANKTFNEYLNLYRADEIRANRKDPVESMRSPGDFRNVSSAVLERMRAAGVKLSSLPTATPSEASGGAAATTSGSHIPTSPAGETKTAKPNGEFISRDEARRMADEAADRAARLAIDAEKRKQAAAGASTEGPTSKNVGSTQKQDDWTPERIKKDPTGYRQFMAGDPRYRAAVESTWGNMSTAGR